MPWSGRKAAISPTQPVVPGASDHRGGRPCWRTFQSPSPRKRYHRSSSMLIRKPADLRFSDVTPKQMYLNRRNFLAGSLALGALAGAARAGKLTDVKKSSYDAGGDKLTPLEAITHYNNFY